jgi:hypothetical protein
MNSVIKANRERAYHTIEIAEFTGIFDRSVYTYDNIYGGNPRFGYSSDYHLFIRYGNKVYMDVKNIGDIVISYSELQKNKFWKHHYDLSLLLTNDKNMVIQDIQYNGKYIDDKIYEEQRIWSIDTAFIESNINTKTKKIINSDDICYYKINPYDMMYTDYASQDALNIFKDLYMTKRELRNSSFDEKYAVYKNLIIDNRY